MELTLKNVKVNVAMSEETMCFSASLYVDGTRAAVVKNRGTGGCNEYAIEDAEAFGAFQAWAEDQVVVLEFGEGETVALTLVTDKLDHFVDEALSKWEEDQWFRRECQRRTIFRLKSDGENGVEWRTVKAAFGPEVKAWLIDRFGDDLAEIANETRI